MKKYLFAFIIVCCTCLSFQSAIATDYSFVNDLTYQELLELQGIVENRIAELASTNDVQDIDPNTTLGNISELFPDEQLAMIVRDQTGKLSIAQSVTQAELDKITRIEQYWNEEQTSIKDLTGIGYLRNLKYLYIWGNFKYKGTELPDDFYTLVNLEELALPSSNLTVLSDKIGDLASLRLLNLYNTPLTLLPDTVGNLTNLKKLYINKTNIKQLPESLYSLEFEEVKLPGGIK